MKAPQAKVGATGLLAVVVLALASPPTAKAEDDERQRFTTRLKVWSGVEGSKQYMSVPGSCGQHRVDMWSHDTFTDNQLWELVPVPVATVKAKMRSEKNPATVYQILSAKDPNCKWKYLSVAGDCALSYSDLWHVDDGSTRQWWYLTADPAIGRNDVLNITQVFRQSQCAGGTYMLSTNGNSVDLWREDDGSGRQKWQIDSPPLGEGFRSVDGEWQLLFECRGCEEMTYSVETGITKGEEHSRSENFGVWAEAAVTAAAEVSMKAVEKSIEVEARVGGSYDVLKTITESFQVSRKETKTIPCRKNLYQWRTTIEQYCVGGLCAITADSPIFACADTEPEKLLTRKEMP